MTNRALHGLLLVLAAAPTLRAQTPVHAGSNARPDLTQLLGRWRAAHGESWRIEVDDETGYLQMLSGGNVPATFHPREDAEFIGLARQALQATAPMHGIESASLVPESTQFLPLGQIGSNDKMTVKMRQEIDGVRVVGGFVNVLFNMEGAVLSIQTTAMPRLASLSTAPEVSAQTALARANEAFQLELGVQANRIGAPELVIDQVRSASGDRVAKLAWQIDLQWHQDDVDPEGYIYFIDAGNGNVLRKEHNVHHFDVSATVNSMASPGTLPDIASNNETAQAMKYMTVTSSSGTQITDANGNFNYAGVNAPLAVTVKYTGTYNNVTNSAGAAYTLTTTLQPNQANTILMNPSSTGTITSQANAFRSIDMMHDYVRGINPTDNHAEFVALSHVNQAQTCNAFYDGVSLNFFAAGGGCPNTAYSTVVTHENGHWMNDRYSTGNGSDGMGEGNSDVWAMYIWDTPLVGANFSGNSAIRTGNNTRHFCGDCCPACYGEVHNDGEPWMGAAWKVRNRLNTTNGNTTGDMIANNLFLGWMNSYNQTQIKSIIETQWLTLDDTDGNILNGTPHYPDIDAGFRDQFFPGVTIQACPTPFNFCSTSPNSVGPGALMTFGGQNKISTNNFFLLAYGLPPNTTGLFFYGQTETLVTFGNGFRCVANPFFRLPAQFASSFGDLTFNLDLNSLPSGGQISAGQIWKFQAWYRNPAGGGAGFNASDALSVEWCP